MRHRSPGPEYGIRWPQFRLDDGMAGLYQAESGIAPAKKINDTRLARRHGATLRENTPVTRITPLTDGVEIATVDATYRCGFLVLAADAVAFYHAAGYGE